MLLDEEDAEALLLLQRLAPHPLEHCLARDQTFLKELAFRLLSVRFE